MSDERGPNSEWDCSQWPEEGTSPDAPAAETWDREQMEPDPPVDDDSDRDPATADDSGPLTGGGQPSGESHWERVDEG
jgi:hypothetical protein